MAVYKAGIRGGTCHAPASLQRAATAPPSESTSTYLVRVRVTVRDRVRVRVRIRARVRARVRVRVRARARKSKSTYRPPRRIRLDSTGGAQKRNGLYWRLPLLPIISELNAN